MNRLRLFLENRIVGRLVTKLADIDGAVMMDTGAVQPAISYKASGSLRRLAKTPAMVLAAALFLVLTSDNALAQAVNDYRSAAATGNWNVLATWERFNGGTWVTPTVGEGTPNNTDGVTTIQSGHIVTVTAAVTVDQVTINSGGQVTVNSAIIWTIDDGTGTDLTVTGTLSIAGTATGTGGPQFVINGTVINAGSFTNGGGGGSSLTFNASSLYQHNQNGGAITTATWNAASTCEVIGITTTVPAGLAQTFGNFNWNSPSQTGQISLAGNLDDINGNFTVTNTGTGSTRIQNTGGGITLDVAGNFSQSGGTFKITGDTSSVAMTVHGSFSLSGGTLEMSGGSGTGTLNVEDDFSISGTGLLTETSTGSGTVNFNGGATTNYSNGGSTTNITNTINFTVTNDTTLQMGTNLIVGGGTFTIGTNESLGIGSAAGITTSGATGNIQVTGTRTFATASNYIYNGTAAQDTGTGFPTGLTGDLIINNPGNTVTLNAVRTIANGGLVNLLAGTFAAGTNLTMATTSSITRSDGSMTGTPQGAGVYDVTYTGASKTTGSELSGSGLSDVNVTLTAGQTLTLGAPVVLDADLTIGAGSTLDVSASNFAISVGDDWTNNGTFTPGTGTVTFDGTGAQVINASQTFNNVIINKSAGALSGTTALTVNDLSLTQGDFNPPATLNVNGNLIQTAGAWATGTNTNIKGDWTRNGGTFTAGAGETVTFNGSMTQTIGGSTATAFVGLTINNAAGVSLNTSGSVSGVLTLTTDLTTTGLVELTQSGTSAAAALGDVVGTVRRADVGTTTRSFGNVNVQINAGLAGITTLTVKLVKMSPPDAQSAVDRTYTITQVSAGAPGATSLIRLRYIDTELHGLSEATLELWKKLGTWTAQGQTARDSVNNWVEKTNIGTFSDWIINGPNAPTDVAMVDLKATRYDNRVLLEWQTGYEVSNIGFHIYRGKKGNFTRITTDPIAGSALIFGPKIALRAGFAYTWWDNNAPAGDDATYWVEDLDMSGRTSIKGPFYVTSSAPGDKSAAGKGDAPTLGAIASKASKLGSSAPVERRAAAIKLTPALLAVQAVTASQQAVKVSVKHEGWYRVEKSDLVAAGFPASADPTKLQLSVDGQEVPIQVTTPTNAPVQGAKPTVAPWDGIEFFGLGIDSPYTDSHVYWLVAGSQNGLRIGQATDQGGAPAPASFQYSVERRDKITYFAGVKNGGAEKFFGPPIFNAVPVDQSVVLKNAAPTGDASVDVSLQGLSDGSHSVRVLLNGTELGTVQFNGRAKGTAQYSIPQSSLLEGSNQVQFISPVGFSDLTLAEFVRVTYEHTNKADDNALRFPVTGSQLATIGGFTSEAIRVVDVTDAASPQEVAVSVAADGAEFAATFTVPGAGARTLLAFAADQKKTPAALVANQPSSWRTSKNGATYIAVTRKDLINSLGPLVTQRRNQGHKTALVDIEDVYDEFSFGNKSALALKDFFAYAKTNWKISPLFALLGGDATYDPKNYMGLGDFDLIPTKLVETNFNETATDDWFVDINGDKVPDIAIGRLPVRSAPETATLVAKIIRYDRSQPVTRVLMVADHNDGYDFEAADTQSQALIPANLTVTGIRRGQVGDALARTQLLDALNVGAKFVNFYGHGSTRLWTDAQILTAADAPNLANTDRLALFDSMTCLTGFFHDVSIESLGEALLKSPGGAIAVWASSGMTDPGNQVLMNEEAIRQLFSGTGLTIGEVTARAKAATGNADVRRTWILLGDPATRLR